MIAHYPGSKGGMGVWQRIISLMPTHRVYVEAFLGSGQVLRRKRPSPDGTIGIDDDAGVIETWISRRDDESLLAGSAGGGLHLVKADAVTWLSSRRAMLDPEVLVYCDPPYLRSVRTKLVYDREFATEEEHRALLDVLCSLPCRVMISGYWSPLYATMLEAWRAVSFPAMTRGGLRQEWVWMNFEAGLPLHDVRYCGDTYRGRERIKRRVSRWASRFAAMSAEERQCIREALATVDRPSPDVTIAAAIARSREERSPLATAADLVTFNDDSRSRIHPRPIRRGKQLRTTTPTSAPVGDVAGQDGETRKET